MNIQKLAVLGLVRLDDDALQLFDADLNVEVRVVAADLGFQPLTKLSVLGAGNRFRK